MEKFYMFLGVLALVLLAFGVGSAVHFQMTHHCVESHIEPEEVCHTYNSGTDSFPHHTTRCRMRDVRVCDRYEKD